MTMRVFSGMPDSIISSTRKLVSLTMVVVFASALCGCLAAQPGNLDNICEIFKEKRSWYKSARKAADRWGVPIHVQMAIIYQESRFEADAKPPRNKLLGLIPTFRPSSAYGYAQIKDDTWDWYRTKSGNHGADRDDFDDVVDFIGWYGDRSYRRLGISKWNAEKQYLAYHEGQGGYAKKTYRQKPWLIKVAHKVGINASRYARQLASCQKELDKGWGIWPF